MLLLTVPCMMRVILCCVEEYDTHASNVQSLCLGQHSGRLLATGGEDSQINLWSLDKPNCQMVSCFDSLFIDFSTCTKPCMLTIMYIILSNADLNDTF